MKSTTFNEFSYTRPDMQHIKSVFDQLIHRIDASKDIREISRVICSFHQLRNSYDTSSELARLRHVISMDDPFYSQEIEYFNRTNPLFDRLVVRFHQRLLSSDHIDAIIKDTGSYFIDLISLKNRIYSDDVIEELQLENHLMSQFTQSIASVVIPFMSGQYNLEEMIPFYESTDREIRQKAIHATSGYWQSQMQLYDDLFDRLVKVRHRMANKLGFENFTQVGYARLQRTDYTAKEVAQFRKHVLKYIVPLTVTIREHQKTKLGLDCLFYHDEMLFHPEGNAVPTGSSQDILNACIRMYDEMSPETGEFIHRMVQRELMDLKARKGKAIGGFCAYLSEFSSPFIFSNFNGTADDIDVLTHEMGHAFAIDRNIAKSVPEFIWPTLEICEIHSMSMEFFAWPWMNLFFGEKEDQYRREHLQKMLLLIPYAALVDEFQHLVYANINMMPAERRACWRQLEKKYLPLRKYENDPFLDSGGYWFRQGHIFKNPFYYIDYALAAICAMHFLRRSLSDRKQSWIDYLQLCERGGSQSFLTLLEAAHLPNPFEEQTMEILIRSVRDHL